MENRLLHTPEGVRDIYGEELKRKLDLENRLLSLLESHGYKRIETPTFEYFDIFSRETGTTPSREVYKFFDSDNNTLALRPDFTPGAARAAAKYFLEGDDPVRLTYLGHTFSNRSDLQGKLKEVTELGLEYMGEPSVEADAEMIFLTDELLKAAGLKDYMICIGNAEYFRGICEAAGLDEVTVHELSERIKNKSYFGTLDILNDVEIDKEKKEALLSFSDYFGGEEVLNEAGEKVGDVPRSLNALKRLKELLERLKKYGIEDRISFDLGMLSRQDYYTGIIFRAYASGSGEAVVRGGRYDNLLKNFGHDKAAVGFTIVIDQLLTIFDSEDKGERYLTFALTKGRLADKTMEMLEKAGITCEEMRDKDTRKLIFVNEEKKLKFFLAKGPDVPTYVEHGVADIGVTGKDTIMEENRAIYEVLDLELGKCRMCICGFPEAAELLKHHEMIKVATKYPNIARDYFHNKKHQTVDIIKLNGSIELAPIVGLSDVICDIVETGKTLKENGLAVLETVCDISARMVVNQVSMRLEAKRIREIVNSLRTR